MAEYSHSRSSTAGSLGDHNANHDAEKLPESMQGDRPARSDPTKRKRSNFGDQSQDDPFGDEAEGDVKYKTLRWWYAKPRCSLTYFILIS